MCIITLTSDFGGEFFLAIMKGVILKINPTARITDITHSITPWSIQEACYTLYCTVTSFPSDTIHVCVVDSGVGGGRKELVFDCEHGTLVGPDNGSLAPAAERLNIRKVYVINRSKLMKLLSERNITSSVSSTFHGRDIFAPTAALLSIGIKTTDLGDETKKYARMDHFGDYSRTETGIRGRVLYIDKVFGSIITSIPGELIKNEARFGDSLHASIKGKGIKARFLETYEKANKGDLLFTISSSGCLEVSCRESKATDKIDAMISDEVIVTLS